MGTFVVTRAAAHQWLYSPSSTVAPPASKFREPLPIAARHSILNNCTVRIRTVKDTTKQHEISDWPPRAGNNARVLAKKPGEVVDSCPETISRNSKASCAPHPLQCRSSVIRIINIWLIYHGRTRAFLFPFYPIYRALIPTSWAPIWPLSNFDDKVYYAESCSSISATQKNGRNTL